MELNTLEIVDPEGKTWTTVGVMKDTLIKVRKSDLSKWITVLETHMGEQPTPEQQRGLTVMRILRNWREYITPGDRTKQFLRRLEKVEIDDPILLFLSRPMLYTRRDLKAIYKQCYSLVPVASTRLPIDINEISWQYSDSDPEPRKALLAMILRWIPQTSADDFQLAM